MSSWFTLGLLVSVALVVNVVSSQAQDNIDETVPIASIDWCPQLCPDNENRGYIFDIVQHVYSRAGVAISVKTVPWTRAIFMTRRGDSLALMSPAKAEAPDLYYPDREVGFQQMCFFTLADYRWKYDGPFSLFGRQVGIASDTSIEELNQFVQTYPELFQFQPYSEDYVLSSLRKLEARRIDAFLFTRNTTQYEIDQLGLRSAYRVAGCVSKSKVYIAFSPKSELRRKVQILALMFDEGIAEMESAGMVEPILQRYNIEYQY